MLRRSGADVLETTLLEKSLSHLLMLENAGDTCIRLVQEMRDQQKTMMKVLRLNTVSRAC